MKILLTMPPTEGIAPSRPPLALGYLAASLDSDDHEIIIRDYRLTSQMPVDEAAVAAAREEPELVAIAAETVQIDDCLEFARVLSQELPETTVVLFGPHPTAKPLETLANDGVDIVVTGETEQTMPELVRRLGRGESADGIAGCAWKDNGELRTNPARPILKNIDQLPLPDRDALQIADYSLKLHSGERMTNILTTRGHPQKGVPYRPTGFGRKYRVRSPEKVVDELADVVEHRGYRAVLFEDPGFTFDQSRLHRILKLIESRDLIVRWECIGLVDVLAEEDYNRMARAGCAAIRFESLTANTLAAEKMNYKISESQVQDAVRWCKDAGIRAKAWFITGLPGETRDQIEQTARMSVELDVDEAYFSVITPLPGTDLWDIAVDVHPELEGSGRYPSIDNMRVGPTQLVFANISGMADSDLVEATVDAYDLFWKRIIRRRQFNERFGEEFGDLIWSASLLTRFTPVKIVKRMFTRNRPQKTDD